MNEQEVINELQTKVKPYIGIMQQGTYSNTIIRYKTGLLKPSTLNSFLEKMGYVKTNGLWAKI